MKKHIERKTPKFQEIRRVLFSPYTVQVPIVLWILFIFLVGLSAFFLAAYANPQSIRVVGPLTIIAIGAALYHPSLFFKGFLFFLPVGGFFNNVLSILSVSLAIPIFLGGLLGKAVLAMVKGEKYHKIGWPLPIWLFFGSTVASGVVALFSFVGHIPHFDAIVQFAPWGDIYLVNALGWLTLGVLSIFCGVLFFEWFLEESHRRDFNYGFLKYFLWGLGITFVVGLLHVGGWMSWGYGAHAPVTGSRQFNATFLNPNGLGLFVAVFFFLWIGVSFQRRKMWSLLWWLPIFVFLMSISGSRSSFLLFGVGNLVLLVLSVFHKNKIGILIFLLLPLLVLMGFFVQKKFCQSSRLLHFVEQIKKVKNVSLGKGLKKGQVSSERPVLSAMGSASKKSPVKETNNGIRKKVKTVAPKMETSELAKRFKEVVVKKKASEVKRNVKGGRVDHKASRSAPQPNQITKVLSGAIQKWKKKLFSIFGDRLKLWKAGWVTFKNNPIMGVGTGLYLVRMPQYANELDTVVNDNCANMVLHVAAEQGIVGLLIFLLLIGSFLGIGLLGGHKRPNFMRDGAVSGLTGLVVAFLFGGHLLNFEVNMMFWLLLAIIVPIDLQKKERRY